MKEKILTDNGVFLYEPVELYLGKKILDPIISKKNLLTFKKVMDKHHIHYGLWFGTLLGAIRENGFIEHDEDTDVFALEEDRTKILNVLIDFEASGLKVARYNEHLISFICEGEYIDIYFYKKSLNQRVSIDNGIDGKILESTKTMKFLGTNFPIPHNPKEALEILYGENWRTPIKNGKAVNIANTVLIKKFLINKLPFFYDIFSKIKNRKIVLNKQTVPNFNPK